MLMHLNTNKIKKRKIQQHKQNIKGEINNKNLRIKKIF